MRHAVSQPMEVSEESTVPEGAAHLSTYSYTLEYSNDAIADTQGHLASLFGFERQEFSVNPTETVQHIKNRLVMIALGRLSSIRDKRDGRVVWNHDISDLQHLVNLGVNRNSTLLLEFTFRDCNPPSNYKVKKILETGTNPINLIEEQQTKKLYAMKMVKVVNESDASLAMKTLLLWSSLEHRNIVPYYGSLYESRQTLRVFSEYMPGGSLLSIINDKNSLTESETRRYVSQILDAVEYLHRYGILHRDIKPGKMLTDNQTGVLKLANFTLSRYIKSGGTTGGNISTLAKTKVGSSNYMAPELFTGDKYGKPVDVWGVGASIVHMLTGIPPWSGYDEFQIIGKISEGHRPHAEIPENTSQDLKDFLEKTFVKNAAERATITQLRQHPFCTSQIM